MTTGWWSTVDDPAVEAAERSLVVACMMDPCRALPLVGFVEAKHVHNPALATVFEAVRRVWRARLAVEGCPVDAAHLIADLKAQREGRGSLNSIGGVAFLHDLLNDWQPASQADTYGRRVIDFARKRALGDLAARLRGLSLDPEIAADDAESRAYAAVRELVAGAPSRGMRSQREVVDELLEAVRSARGSEVSRAALSGWDSLDSLTGGGHGGELIIIAARPAMGKTIAAENYAKHVAAGQRRPVGFFSEEMKAPEVLNRRVSGDAGVAARAATCGALSDEETAAYEQRAEAIADLPIHWHDTANVTIEEIAAHARALRHAVGDIGLVVIDYAQRLRTSRREHDERQHAGHVAKSAKTLARELDCPVILLSQLSRDLEKRGDKRPMMADLRDSGVLEQEADTILFLYREHVYNKSADPRAAEIIIGKHRHAPCDTVRVTFRGDIGRFLDDSDHPAMTPWQYGPRDAAPDADGAADMSDDFPPRDSQPEYSVGGWSPRKVVPIRGTGTEGGE